MLAKTITTGQCRSRSNACGSSKTCFPNSSNSWFWILKCCICDRLAVGAGSGSTRAKQRLEAPGKRERPSKMEPMPLPHLTCFPQDPVRVIVFFNPKLAKKLGKIPALMGKYIPLTLHIYIYTAYIPMISPLIGKVNNNDLTSHDLSWEVQVGRSWRLKYGATCFLTKEVRELLSQGTVINNLSVSCWLHICIHLHFQHVYIYNMYTFICIHIYIYIYIYVYIHPYIILHCITVQYITLHYITSHYIHTYTHLVYVYIYMVYTCICTYTYIYIYIIYIYPLVNVYIAMESHHL